MLPDILQNEIDKWIVKYPKNHRQSALIPALLVAQKYHQGWLSNAMIEAVADYIKVSHIAAYEVVTFYSMFELKPVGNCKISICTNISCMLQGCSALIHHTQKMLNVKFGETTPDQKFTLKESECLGACIRAPVITINGKYYDNMTITALDKLLENFQ